MNPRTIGVTITSLIVGALLVFLVSKLLPCEPAASYVVEWNGAHIDPSQVNAFRAALRQKAVFTHHLVVAHQPGVNEAPELENVGLGVFCFGSNSPGGSLHVTQRAGLNSFEDLKTIESFLSH